MFGLGTQELIIILAIGGILFGAKKLPEVGKGLGEAIRGFKKSVNETEKEITHQTSVEETSGEEKEKKADKA
jgi:sec-independent protein translocase protein TatA